MTKHVIFICDHFKLEVDALKIIERFEHVHVVCFNGHCGKPPVQWDDYYQSILTQYDNISVDTLGGACVASEESHSPVLNDLRVHALRQCFHLIVNPSLIDMYVKQGYYLVTPGWLANWRGEIAHWGFETVTARAFFAESAKRILLLDTGVTSDALQQLQDFAEFVGLPFDTITVGLGYFSFVIDNLIMKRNLEREQNETEIALREAQQNLSGYAMALDLLQAIPQSLFEEGAVAQMADMYRMLFAADKVVFTPAAQLSSEQSALQMLPNGFILPIRTPNGDIGLFTITDFQFPKFSERYLNLATQISGVCGLVIENARYYQEFKRMADTDGLTQIANRRCMEDHLKREWRRLNRDKQPLSIVMLDVDNFKHYNDSYGHLAGDVCLRAIAQALQKVCKRPSDMTARYGGEEFILILPNTDGVGAKVIAEEARIAITKLAIPHTGADAADFVTISGGIFTAIPTNDTTSDTLIKYADKSLYTAKESGRNRIVATAT